MNSRTTALLAGGLAGAMLGMLVAWIITESEGPGTEVGPGGAVKTRKKIGPTDAINLTTAAINIARQIAVLRQR